VVTFFSLMFRLQRRDDRRAEDLMNRRPWARWWELDGGLVGLVPWSRVSSLIWPAHATFLLTSSIHILCGLDAGGHP